MNVYTLYAEKLFMSSKYSYANGSELIAFSIKNDKTKAALTHVYNELVVSKQPKASL